MSIITIIDTAVQVAPEVITVATGVVTAASIITAGTKTPDPSTFWGKCYKVIELFALVFGKAKQSGLIK